MAKLIHLVPAMVWAMVVWFIGGMPSTPAVPPVPGIDKIAHFAMYGVLGWLCGRGWSAVGGGAAAAVILALALAMGAGDELRQAALPGRSADPLDWLADAAGVMTGFFLAVSWMRRRQG